MARIDDGRGQLALWDPARAERAGRSGRPGGRLSKLGQGSVEAFFRGLDRTPRIAERGRPRAARWPGPHASGEARRRSRRRQPGRDRGWCPGRRRRSMATMAMALAQATLAGLVAGKGLAVDSGLSPSHRPPPADPDATAAVGVGDTTSSGGRPSACFARTPAAWDRHGQRGARRRAEPRGRDFRRSISEQADDLASRALFVLEAEVTVELEHPGDVPVYGLDVRPKDALTLPCGSSAARA